MSAMAELEASLQALLACKPPGVTKTRISSITTLCVENVKSESVLVTKIFVHFKRTPGTHKLGVLYVVDSVVREWIAKAAASGQDLNGGQAADGTFAAGVHRVTKLLPSFMSELIANVPEDQKEKVAKLIGIWDRGKTFPKAMLSDFESKLAARNQQDAAAKQPAPTPAAAPAMGASAQQMSPIDILTALQRPPAAAAPQPNGSSQPTPAGFSAPFAQPASNGFPPQQQAPSQQPQNPFSAFMAAQSQPASVPLPQQPGNMNSEGLAALASILPPSALADPTKLGNYLQILQQLVSLGVPSHSWKDVINALEEKDKPQSSVQQTGATQYGTQPVNDRAAQRDRSRSPGGPRSPGLQSYRRRSPPRRASPTAPPPRTLENDPTLPPDHIKVMSRTLFVGGTTCPESELRQIFSRFGNVQSVITNNSKRHAFVKMCTRRESVLAKDGMDNAQDPEITSRARSVKWGVGFGPRECCDYSQGISVIPIHRLTDADRRWIVSAEYGGTGGIDIAGGQVMEEPDIEIGAGVSSKAISLKVGASADNRRGGGRGKRFDRFQAAGQQQQQQQHQQQQQQQHQQQQQQQPQQQQGLSRPSAQAQISESNANMRQQRSRRDDEPNMVGAPPAVPGFGFQLPAGIPPLGSAQPPFGR